MTWIAWATEILRNINFESPIFACSAEDDPEKISLLLRSGFDDFLPKPIEPEDISNILTKHSISKDPPPSGNDTAYQEKLDSF